MSPIAISKITLDAIMGQLVDLIELGLTLANTYHCQVRFLFNGTFVSCNPNQLPADVYSEMEKIRTRVREEQKHQLRKQLQEMEIQLTEMRARLRLLGE